MNKEQVIAELYEDYLYLRDECEAIKKELKISGRTTESRANGAVRHPNVTILDTYIKQMLAIAKLLGINETNISSKNNAASDFMKNNMER